MKKNIIGTIGFILVFIILFTCLSGLMRRKSLDTPWDHTNKIAGFYNEPENEFDVMLLGSSNTYCSFNPLVIYEETGIKSYVFASQQQPVWATYTYMKEALKTQTPDVIVIDVLMFAKFDEYFDDGVNYSFMDDIPLSKNKIELAWASESTNAGRFSLLCSFVKYHSRWSEMSRHDLTYVRSEAYDYLKGYVLLEDTFTEVTAPDYTTEEITPIGEKQEKYLDLIIDLAEEEGITLLLVKTPSNVVEEDQKLFNYVKKVAEERGVAFLDFNGSYDDIGLDLGADFYDKSHLNYKGAEKFSTYFARQLTSLYPVCFSDTEADDEWDSELERYREYIKGIQK